MSLHLTVIAGPDKGRTFPVHAEPDLMLGRGASAYYQLTDPKVARNHCVLMRDGDAVTVICNGDGATLINGRKVDREALSVGDVLQVGDSQVRLESDEALPPSPDAPTDEPLESLSGHMLSHYAVGPVIGRGRFGLVFVAVDTKHKQAVALKVLRPELARDEDEIQCFIKAMKAHLPLRHPNLVTLHGAGKTGPYCWMALDHVDGLNMAQVIRLLGIAGPLPWPFALQVATHVARALDFAHGHRLLHHNVTPTNILLDTPTKTVKLNNLLLAQALDRAPVRPTQAPDETTDDVEFLAPEQTVAGAKVDVRTDLYGLGATVYGLLTGRAPCHGKTVAEMVATIQKETPELPRTFQASIPPRLEKVVMKLLARQPADRFTSAKELLADLDKLAKSPA